MNIVIEVKLKFFLRGSVDRMIKPDLHLSQESGILSFSGFQETPGISSDKHLHPKNEGCMRCNYFHHESDFFHFWDVFCFGFDFIRSLAWFWSFRFGYFVSALLLLI